MSDLQKKYSGTAFPYEDIIKTHLNSDYRA